LCKRSNLLHRDILDQLANTLFNIWIQYKPRLPEWYYNEQLVKVGDALVEIKFHVLEARNICIYQIVFSTDRNLQNPESLQTCLNVLTSFQLIMQEALPQENLCWLIYNGTIHIYTICRQLMMRGQSAKVLEYLLWASVCMESSIPLLSVHYLTWRATLYTAVSQCYFDCEAGIHGEVFWFTLCSCSDKINLEIFKYSYLLSDHTCLEFLMIFKRAVYESRRKSKLPGPITSAAAQFLAILEALADSNRNLLPPHPPAPDETEIRDVISELFSAGLEILSENIFVITAGEKGVSGDAAVKFVKLAFSYEEWDVFDSALEFVVSFLQAQDDPAWKKAETELKLLTLMQPLVFPGKFERNFSVNDDNNKGATPQEFIKNGDPFYDLTILATTVFSCVSTSEQNVHPDREILVGVVMCLWQKCKTELQQIQTSGSDYLEYMHKHKAYQVLLHYNVFLLFTFLCMYNSSVWVFFFSVFKWEDMEVN
uniref:Cilia and flagella associated protein 54 n=1 Tax=Malurus cyaneus samueli TaxID=2593467 RepID=A0A8C5X8R5_9PASS